MMDIDLKLLEIQITHLSSILNKKLSRNQRLSVEGLLNFLGELSNNLTKTKKIKVVRRKLYDWDDYGKTNRHGN